MLFGHITDKLNVTPTIFHKNILLLRVKGSQLYTAGMLMEQYILLGDCLASGD